MTTATGHREFRNGTSYVVYHRRFRASIDDVWAAITEPDRLARWIGTWSGDPSTGSVDFSMTAEGEDIQPARYLIDECSPPATLRVRTGPESDPDAMWCFELDLVEADGITTLTFAQAMDDAGMAESVGPGWDYYLDRLVAVEGGETTESVVWDQYYPALASHYRREFEPSSA